jgi:hypothetical protein
MTEAFVESQNVFPCEKGALTVLLDLLILKHTLTLPHVYKRRKYIDLQTSLQLCQSQYLIFFDLSLSNLHAVNITKVTKIGDFPRAVKVLHDVFSPQPQISFFDQLSEHVHTDLFREDRGGS